jgi:hypothetical protein
MKIDTLNRLPEVLTKLATRATTNRDLVIDRTEVGSYAERAPDGSAALSAMLDWAGKDSLQLGPEVQQVATAMANEIIAAAQQDGDQNLDFNEQSSLSPELQKLVTIAEYLAAAEK